MKLQDSVWKEAIEAYFQEFMEFFFFEIAQNIDFERQHT